MCVMDVMKRVEEKHIRWTKQVPINRHHQAKSTKKNTHTHAHTRSVSERREKERKSSKFDEL